MKKLGDAIGRMDMAGHMGRGENSEAAEGSSPCTPSSKDMELINLKSRGRGEGGTCTPPIVPPTTPKKSATPESQNPAAPVSLDVALRASLPLGIPDWFIAYWYEKQNAFDWVTTHGKKLTAYTWKSNLLSWWNHKTPLEKASIEGEYKDAMKSAADELDDPEPVIAFTRRHWWMCQSKCLNYKHGKCSCGAARPACFCACNDGFTERCKGFKAVPWAWQHVWLLAPGEWEAHWAVDAWRKKYWHPGWKATEKGQRVKAYFEAHPEELEEAKWRDEANAVTEVEVRDADVYLAWVDRARKGVKEGGVK
jgi:hypothetical protein